MESFVAELEAAVQTIWFAHDVGIQRGRVLVGVIYSKTSGTRKLLVLVG